MIERGRGAIVNISSGSATGPGRGPYGGQQPGQAVLYGATKAALERLTQGLAEELYEHGITVAAVAPSQVVLTPGALFHQGSWEFTGDSEPGEYMARAALLPRRRAARSGDGEGRLQSATAGGVRAARGASRHRR